MRDNKAWGKQLGKWRQSVGLSQNRFVEALSGAIRDLSPGDEQTMKSLGLFERDGLTPHMLSKYEQGERVPDSRSRHLLLLWGLTRTRCPLSPADANAWLILGGQGLLAEHELALIFGGGTPLYALPITPVREAALDEIVQQLLHLLRRLNELKT